jgi:hypothetical protein
VPFDRNIYHYDMIGYLLMVLPDDHLKILRYTVYLRYIVEFDEIGLLDYELFFKCMPNFCMRPLRVFGCNPRRIAAPFEPSILQFAFSRILSM